MLTALNEKNELVSLFQFNSRDQLTKIHANSSFICSSCKAPVILKIGRIKIPHFAHHAKKNCSSASEGETDNHLNGKKSLYSWLHSLGLNPELEKVYEEIGRRADIGVKSGNLEYAIEYQCSAIAPYIKSERTKDYRSLNIIPFWILSYETLQLSESRIVKLTEFHQQFLRYSEALKQYFLLLYSSEMTTFMIIYLIAPLSKYSFIVRLERLPQECVPFPHIPVKFSSLDAELFSSYLIHREKWIINRYKYNVGIKDQFLRMLYEGKETILLNPPWNGLPMRSNLNFTTYACEWQTYLYLYMKKGGIMTEKKLIIYMEKLIKQGVIALRRNQADTSCRFVAESVNEWLEMMEACHIVIKIGDQYSLNPDHIVFKIDCVENRNKVVEHFMNNYMHKIIELYNAR
ncbi:competence protein CoiA [Jeotgalibacillus aurantiacus]|uniref:competence protein CoiA n=1 Tax=Jeotgalibacillus aurantiacus TaxID=2763266 RepID=UPI001D0A8F94|nr:competence protein CoiA family protein [Jeotgalibacillus aurantiacus]